MKINIKSEDGSTGNAEVTLEDGSRLDGVERIVIDAKGSDGVIRAQLTFFCPKVLMKSMPAFISEDHLRELADAHGFDLVKRNG